MNQRITKKNIQKSTSESHGLDARLKIHMKHQALFSLKDKSKKEISVVCCKFLFGIIRVNRKIRKYYTKPNMIRRICFYMFIHHRYLLTLSVPETKIAEFANCVDLDEVAHNEPPHLDLHCLLCSLLNSQFDIDWT